MKKNVYVQDRDGKVCARNTKSKTRSDSARDREHNQELLNFNRNFPVEAGK